MDGELWNRVFEVVREDRPMEEVQTDLSLLGLRWETNVLDVDSLPFFSNEERWQDSECLEGCIAGPPVSTYEFTSEQLSAVNLIGLYRSV